MKKGQENELGKDWKHLGENGLFYDETVCKSDLSVIVRNDKFSSYTSIKYENGKIITEAFFESSNAEKLMVKLGYKKVTKQATQEIETLTAVGGIGGPGEVNVSLNRKKAEYIEKVGYVPKNYEIIGTYRLSTPKPATQVIGGGISTEIVQYRFEYGKKPWGLKLLDILIRIGNIQTGNIEFNH